MIKTDSCIYCLQTLLKQIVARNNGVVLTWHTGNFKVCHGAEKRKGTYFRCLSPSIVEVEEVNEN